MYILVLKLRRILFEWCHPMRMCFVEVMSVYHIWFYHYSNVNLAGPVVFSYFWNSLRENAPYTIYEQRNRGSVYLRICTVCSGPLLLEISCSTHSCLRRTKIRLMDCRAWYVSSLHACDCLNVLFKRRAASYPIYITRRGSSSQVIQFKLNPYPAL